MSDAGRRDDDARRLRTRLLQLGGDAARERLAGLEEKVSVFTRAKVRFQEWVQTSLLQGTKQEALLRICITAFVLLLLKNITGYIQEMLMVWLSERVVRDLRNRLFAKLTAMPLSFYHRHKAGELISRAAVQPEQ